MTTKATAQHREGPSSGTFNSDGVLGCRCRVSVGRESIGIAWCPLHAAAREMLALLCSLVNDAVLPARWSGPDEDGIEVIWHPDEAARALLARIEGR